LSEVARGLRRIGWTPAPLLERLARENKTFSEFKGSP
jgi:hypothetical protein